jgi:hypothetical protein
LSAAINLLLSSRISAVVDVMPAAAANGVDPKFSVPSEASEGFTSTGGGVNELLVTSSVPVVHLPLQPSIEGLCVGRGGFLAVLCSY